MRYLRFTFSPIEKEKVSSSLDLSGHQLAEPMSVAGQRSSAQSKASSSPCSLRCPSVRQGCQHASCQDFPTEQTEASPFGAEERWCLTFLPRESLPTQSDSHSGASWEIPYAPEPHRPVGKKQK